MTAVRLNAHAGAGRWKQLLDLLIAWGPQGLFLLAILDSAGVPVVGGVDLLLVNVAAANPSKAYWAAGCAVAGSLVGSAILFALARKGGDLMLSRYLSTARGARIHSWFERYGLVTVFVPALSPLPLPMKIPVACAGALKVRWSYFLSVVLAARCLRYFALAFFGARYGAQTLLYLKTRFPSVALSALMIAAILVIGLQIMDRHRRRRIATSGKAPA